MIKFVINPKSAYLSDCNDLSYYIENLDKNEKYKIQLENATSRHRISNKSSDVGVIHDDSLFVNNIEKVEGKISLNLDESLSNNTITLYANIYKRTDNNFILHHICSFTFFIKSKLAIKDDIEINIHPSFIGYTDRTTVNLKAKPHSKLQLAINSKKFIVRTNFQGEGSISFRGSDVANSSAKKIESMQKFSIEYAKDEDNFSQFFDTGLHIHFIPEVMRTLQATNIETEPACAVIDRSPVNGTFLEKIDNFCDSNSVIGEGSIFSDESFYSNKIGFCSDELEIAPRESYKSCRIYNSTSVSYLENGTAMSVISAQLNDATKNSLASRVLLNITPSSYKFVGGKNYVGTVVKPYRSTHKITFANIRVGSEITLSFRFSNSVIFDLQYTSVLGSIADVQSAFVSFIESDNRLQSYQVDAFAANNYIVVRSDVQFTIKSATKNASVVIKLKDNTVLDFMAEIDAIKEIEKNQYDTVVMLDSKTAYQTHRIVGYNKKYSVVYLEMKDGYNNDIGPSFIDYVGCQNFVLINSRKQLLDEYKYESAGIVLPSLYDSLDNEISCIYPEIITIRKKIWSDDNLSDYTHADYAHVFCQAPINGVNQIFHIASKIGPKNSVDFTNTNWKQLTFTKENKNVKIAKDGFENLHIVWESDRLGATQLYYSCVGLSSCVVNNQVLTTTIEKNIKNNYPIQLLKFEQKPQRLIIDPTRILGNNGKVSTYFNTSVSIDAEVSKDVAMACFTLQKDENNYDFQANFVQLSYQINFDFRFSSASFNAKSDADVEQLYQEFISKYRNAGDYKYTDDDNNIFTISRYEKYYNNIVPFCSSLKIDTNLLSSYLGGAAVDFWEHNGPNIYYMYDKPLNLTNNSNVRHFVLGLLPEKILIKAKNTETFVEFCTRNNISLQDNRAYRNEEIFEIYTGRYKIALLLNTSDNEENEALSTNNYKIYKVMDKIFNYNESYNYKVAVHYSKTPKEYLQNQAIISRYNFEDSQKYLGDIIVSVDDKEVCAANFFVDFIDQYRKFDICFGIPYGQGFVINPSKPYKGNSYEKIKVSQIFENIKIGPHSIKLNEEYLNFSKYDRNIEQMCVTEAVTNIISNRSFETTVTPFQPSTKLLDGFISIQNWIVGYGCILRMDVAKYQTAGLILQGDEIIYSASHGEKWIELTGAVIDGTINYGYIQQTFDTKLNKEYVVFFDACLSPETYKQGSNITKSVEVSAANYSKIYRLSDTVHNPRKMSWKTYKFVFRATELRTSLKFRNVSQQFSNTNDIIFGPQIDNIYVYDASNFGDEFTSYNIYKNLEISKDEWLKNYNFNTSGDFTQIPITLQTDRQNKTPSLCVDKSNKIHISYQSNRDDVWNIYYSGSKAKSLPFLNEVKITGTDSTSINSAISVDNTGRKIIAWQDDRSGKYQIYAALCKTKDGNLVDDCKQSLLDAIEYRRNFEVDTYGNPYNDIVEQFPCQIRFSFTADANLKYHFSLYLYEDEKYETLNKAIHSKLDISGWYADDIPMSYLGLDANEGLSYTISYQPSAEDDLQNKVFYVKVAYELKSSYIDFIKSANVEIIEPYNGLDTRPGKLQSDNAVRAILESDAPSPRAIPPQSENVLNRGGVVGCTFAGGLTALPGVNINAQAQSILLHFDPISANKGINTSIKFNRPILALILNGNDLSLSNPVYGHKGIIYGNLVGTGMDAADTIHVSSDRTAIDISFSETSAVDEIRVILESNNINIIDKKLLYYCPNKQESRCNIVCNYVNNSTQSKKVHFRITFFANPEKTDIVLSTFTKYDSLNWEIGDGQTINSSGLLVNAYESINVTYTPEILPFDLFASQNIDVFTTNLVKQNLLCGMNYTIVIESFVDNEFLVLEESTFACDCADVNNFTNLQNFSENGWISSANGFDDYKITETNNLALHPKIITSISNLAYIVWQDYRYTRINDEQRAISPDYFLGIYDFENDKFITSGQGRADTRLTQYSENNLYLFDQSLYMDGFQNLNIIFHDGFRLYWKSCTYGCRLKQIKLSQTNGSDGTGRSNICGFTDDTNNTLYKLGKEPERTVQQYQKIRFSDSSISYSTYLDNKNPIPIINDCLVELDIVGVPGTYAYRLRNENDENWSAWLPINANLPEQKLKEAQITENTEEIERIYEQIALEQDFFRAYFIEKERFIAPWITSKNDGSKRICCEILTFFGKTDTFCIDFVAKYEQLEYKIDLFFDSNFEQPLPSYNSMKVASTNKVVGSITENDLSSLNAIIETVNSIYVRLEFKDKEKINVVDRLRKFDKYNQNFTMSVIQQGLNDQYNLPLTKIYHGVYSGVFSVYKNDGFVNQDGLAYIILNLPNTCNGVDLTSLYQINKLKYYKNNEQKISIFDNYTTYKDVYNADDPKYIFGNDRYFAQSAFDFSSRIERYKKSSWIGGGVGQMGYGNNYDGRIKLGDGSNQNGGNNNDGANGGGAADGGNTTPQTGGMPAIRPDGTIYEETNGGVVYPPWCNQKTGECSPPPIGGN